MFDFENDSAGTGVSASADRGKQRRRHEDTVSTGSPGGKPLGSRTNAGAVDPVSTSAGRANAHSVKATDATMRLLAEHGGAMEEHEHFSLYGGWRVGACSKRGKRHSNEDRYVVIDDLRDWLQYEAEPSDSAALGAGLTLQHKLSQALQGLWTDSFVNRDVPVSEDVDLSHTERVGRLEAQHARVFRKEGYFAVFDGHGGDAVAIHLANHLHSAIARYVVSAAMSNAVSLFLSVSHPDYQYGLDSALHDTCLAMDREVIVRMRGEVVSFLVSVFGVCRRTRRI